MLAQSRNKIKRIIIHCSATTPTMNIGAKWIDDIHRNEKGYDKIGYHFVICRDGVIEFGRAIEEVGAHTTGYNTGSIGICLVGGIDKRGNAENNFTGVQFDTLKLLVQDLRSEFRTATVHGHNEFAKKACPSFNVQEWMKSNDN